MGSASVICDYHKRIKKLVARLNGISFEMETMDRLVTGISYPHPLENSLAWHHTLGVPFLPGSSIKGVLRSWLESWKTIDQEVIDRVFGKDKPAPQVGTALFFDAIPVGRVKCQADIMTPHFQTYYSQDGNAKVKKETKKGSNKKERFPTEHSIPIPIPFLTVAPGQKFLFFIAPRNAAETLDIEQIRSWLEEALKTIGFGAKTAIGYGRLRPDQ